MLRISMVFLALASIVALNGCTQCGNNDVETAPQEFAPPEQSDDVPAPPVAPEGMETDGANTEIAPTEPAGE